MRILAATAVLILSVDPDPARAATSAGRFTVSVVVQASCSISVSALIANLKEPAGAAVRACSPAKGLTPGIATPTPTVTVAYDSVSRRSIMTVEF